MKKIKLFSALLALVVFTACDKDDESINNVYDEVNGQIGVGFTTSGTSVSVKPEGAVVTLGVQSTVTTTSDRNYDVMVNEETSTGNAGHYSIGNITIPAGSYDGLLTVNMIDDGTLLEGVSYDLVLDLDLPADVAVHTSKTATITYNQYLLCNDFTLVINDDFYSSERTWDVTDSAGNVVESGGPYANGTYTIPPYTMTLADGCYTFTIYDSYGDGQFDGTNTGSYSLDCSIINAANGGGNWGSSESTDFCVNP
jgi:hypothetical protein